MKNKDVVSTDIPNKERQELIKYNIDFNILNSDKFLNIDDEIYYINPKNLNNIKLTNRNWTKFIDDWERIDKEWIKRFNSILKTKGKPSQFAIFDVPSDGHCLFNSIACAFNYKNKKQIYNLLDIRYRSADMITQEKFEFILESFKSADEAGELMEEIDLEEIKEIDDLKEIIKDEELGFWGDYSCILLIQEAFNINILVLGDNFKMYPLLEDFKKERNTIILFYIEDLHFQLVGYFNNKEIKTVFEYDSIPEEIKMICEEDCNMKI